MQQALIGGQPLPVDTRRVLELALQGRLGDDERAVLVQCLLERMGAHKQRVAACACACACAMVQWVRVCVVRCECMRGARG